MEANTSLTILVAILSAALAVFLILGIIFMVKLIQVANTVKRITAKAEEIADKAEMAAEMFQNAAAPMAFGRVLSTIVEAVTNHKKKRD